jgi:tetratricopeptide (TPR) repeat protein
MSKLARTLSGSRAGESKELRTFFAFVVCVPMVHWASWYYLDLDVSWTKVAGELFFGGGAAVAYTLLSKPTKTRIRSTIRSIFASRRMFITLVALNAAILLGAAIVSRMTVEWRDSGTDIEINTHQVKEDDINTTKDGIRSTSIFGWSFSTVNIAIGSHEQSASYRPLIPRHVVISEQSIFAGSTEYEEITTLLMLSFYQYLENRFLGQAHAKFAADNAKRFQELTKIYQILQLCFIENDIARNGDFLLALYGRQFRSSSWTNLLRACLSYSRREYEAATKQLSTVPASADIRLQVTYVFFRGVNYIRTYIAEKVRITEKLFLVQKALEDFEWVERKLATQPADYFHEIAVPSAQILRGIVHVYERQLGKATEQFNKATGAAHPSIRARAYNDLGYVELIVANLEGAERHLLRALENDGNFPYALMNIGYVYMAQGKFDSARATFQRIIENPLIKLESQRDIVLAKLALAHMSTQLSGPGQFKPETYDEVLKELRLHDFVGVTPQALRLGFIHKSIGDTVYRSPDYYGLDIFAMTMYARAYFEAQYAVEENAGAGAITLRDEALAAFNQMRASIDRNWFQFAGASGFFGPVYRLLSTQNDPGPAAARN